MYKLNEIQFSTYGIIPGKHKGEDIAVKGVFDLPKRIGETSNDWADENSVEPFVEVDEILLGGRALFFTGIMLGSVSEMETNLNNFKNAIDGFINTVPFETPYGSFCVTVKSVKILKEYIGGKTFVIEFREPDLDGICTVGGSIVVYESDDYSKTAIKNNCDTGYNGSTVNIHASMASSFPFTSTISKAAANKLAEDWVLENMQDIANTTGTCSLNPITYYNIKLTGELTKDNCSPGYFGSIVKYEVAAFKYSSLVSQADANAKAQAELDSILTQAYANTNGTCSLEPSFIEIYNVINGITMFGNTRLQKFRIGQGVQAAQNYNIMIYGVTKTFHTISTDTAADVALGLGGKIMEATNWNEYNQAPQTFVGMPPFASIYGEDELWVTINAVANATIWID